MSSLGGGSFLDTLLGGYKTILSNGLALFARRKLNFIGATVVDNPSLQSTDVFVSSGSGGGSLLLIQNNGAPLPTEPILNLRAGFTVADDPGNTRTNVDVSVGLSTPVVLGSGSGLTTLTALQTWVVFDAGAGPIALPSVPVAGRIVLFTHRAGLLESGSGTPVTVQGNGHNVIDPQDLLAASAATQTLHTSGVNYAFAFDGSVFRCVQFG